MTDRMPWPDGHRFAFSIFDDTDWTTLANGPAVYDLLAELDLKVTKSVWMLDPGPTRTTGGGTCDDVDYLRWVTELQSRGHEIGYHNASDRSSERGRTLVALDRFAQVFGHAPRVGADHAGNREALYAGPDRVSGVRAAAYRGASRVTQPRRPRFSGADPSSPYFWGDVCRDRIEYWRRFTFARTNLDSPGPVVYRDPTTPWVNTWFDSSHGPRISSFVERLRSDRLDRLESDGGVCIMYTHFGIDFVDEHGRVDPRLREALTDLRSRNGWFVPVSQILDRVRDTVGVVDLSRRQRARLERRWILDRLKVRAPIGPAVATHAD